MSLALPTPVHPAASAATLTANQTRAHRRYEVGQDHARCEEWPLAARAFEQATQLHSDEAYGLAAAHAYIKAGRALDAIKTTRTLRRAHPQCGLAYTLESHALLELGRAEEAATCLSELPEAVPREHAYWVSLALSLQRSHRHNDAISAFMNALSTQMSNAVLHFQLGMSFKDLGLKREASECVRTALVLGLGKSDLAARGQLAFMERETCNWPTAAQTLAELRAALAQIPDDVPAETSPFSHAVLVDDPLETLKVARHYALNMARNARPLPRRAVHKTAKDRSDKPKRLRIGYLSADFHQHATSQLMMQMLESHDRSQFEVFMLSAGPQDGSDTQIRVRKSCEHFEELRGRSFESMAHRIRELKIDILVDLKGATYDTLLNVLAHRPAPLQITWLGFPGSTGAPFIDYVIGDPIVTPLENATHFSEKIAQLPTCYQPNDAHRALPQESTRADWHLSDNIAEDALVLCAFHQSYKISAEVFDRWCELLHALPNAVLWLLQWNLNVQTQLIAAAEQRGIAKERLVFAPLLPLNQHISRLACADIYLDAWPCNAHTTAGEALWCGVPVVTIQGPTFAQRVAPSLLNAVGLNELVCDDGLTYQATVLALAADPQRRLDIKAHLLNQRTDSSLFNGALRAREMEALWRRMWERSKAGQSPEHLAAELLLAL
jgi:predicted O-linked N-acetylglucosamine transferase (SPINDLY family)